MIRIMTLTMTLLAGNLAKADELPEPRTMLLNRGVICDTQEQVETVLTQMSLQQQPNVEGCGMLRTTMPAVVEPIGWYETPAARSLIASFTTPDGWVQYGWIAFEMNPEWQVEPSGMSL